MLQQEAIIERVQRVCKANESLAAAMMYGSFAQGEGEGLSDIEFKLFFEDAALENLDQEEWASRISPVESYFVNVYFVNEYGSGTAKRLEVNIFFATYARFAAGTARLDGDRIRRAYPCAWDWGGEMVAALSGRHGPVVPVTLLEKLDRRFTEALQDPRPGTK